MLMGPKRKGKKAHALEVSSARREVQLHTQALLGLRLRRRGM